jgi:hypothetical protein
VAGFLATLLALEVVGFGNRADPITSGLLALLVFAPAGAIAGLVIGTRLGMRWRGAKNAGGLARNSLKSFGVVLALCAAVGGAYGWYALSTATPWLNRNGATPILNSRFAFPQAQQRRRLRKTSRSNCRPTRTPCRASRGSSNSAATATAP